MKSANTFLILLASFAAAGLSFPAPAVAQHGAVSARSENARATADLRSRFVAARQRVTDAQRSGAISRPRAATLRRQLARNAAEMARLERQQGFVSAAELASFNRTLGAIEVELDGRGVPRPYGNDMLVAPPAVSDAGGFRYDCVNAPVRIAIPGDDLVRALGQLRLATRCPISGTDLAAGKRSRPVVGTMTPTEALQAMLAGTGLQMMTIKGGFEVMRQPR